MNKAEMTYEQLISENRELKIRLEEASDAIEAIRTGKIDALIVNNDGDHQLYTLKTADQTYRVFIEKMNEGAVTINRQGLILYSNSQFAEMVNTPLEKVIGLSLSEFVPDELKVKYNSLIDFGWEADCKEEIDLCDTNNKRVPSLLSCTTLELDGGIALSIILTDLTMIKDVEKQLKIKNDQLEAAQLATEMLNDELEDTVKSRTNELFLSREHFKYLANNIPQITWTNDPDGRMDYCNQMWFTYTGLTPDETKEDGWKKVIHPDDLENTKIKYLQALQSGETLEIENRLKRNSDGTYRWHLNRAIPLRDEAGEIVFWVGTATDIEDHKRELEKKDEFIGIASHELRTPLTGVKGYLQLIGSYKKEELPPIVKQYVTKANAALNKLQHLVNDLLDVSKIQAGRLDYNFGTVNLSQLIKDVIEDTQHVYPDNIFINQGSDNFFVHGNPERLEQVLNNLINNAVKYSQENKKVIIKTSSHQSFVRVSVTDFGIGLSEGQKKRIFERFYRVEDKKYMAGGLGMGLYISSEIIKGHKGKIGVESELGKGATFYFDLPLIP